VKWLRNINGALVCQDGDEDEDEDEDEDDWGMAPPCIRTSRLRLKDWGLFQIRNNGLFSNGFPFP